jgi:solute carrier family 35, member F5
MTGKIFGFLLLGSIFNNVISDYLWARYPRSLTLSLALTLCSLLRSVVLTSPTIATVGLSITIPLAILSDYLFFSIDPTWMSLGGGFLVIVGFVCVSAEDTIRSQLDQILQKDSSSSPSPFPASVGTTLASKL